MNLAEWLKAEHPLTEQCLVMLGIARALSEAHNVGSCHGDAVAPGRIEVQPGDQIRFLGGASDAIESQYRPPELADGGDLSPRSDVFAAGAIFYEILAGRHPYAGESLTGLLVVDFDVQPEHLRQKRSDISGDLADAIMACLEKDPDWRAKDLDYVIEMLQKAQATSSSSLRGPAASASPRAKTIPPRAAPVPPRPQPRRAEAPSGAGGGRGTLLGAVAVVVLLAGAGAGWFFLSGDNGSSAAPTPPPTTVARVESAPTEVETTPVPPPTTAPAEVTATPTPVATPEPTPTPLAENTPAPTPTPRATPRPTPARAATPAPTPTPAPVVPSEPAALSHLTPPSLQRRPNLIVDIRGTGLRADHKPVILKGGKTVPGVEVVRLKFSGPELIQMLLTIDPKAPTGVYTLRMVDGTGAATNTINFKVVG